MYEKVKQIKIDEDLFRMIYQYFIYGREDETELIKAGLKDDFEKHLYRKQDCRIGRGERKCKKRLS